MMTRAEKKATQKKEKEMKTLCWLRADLVNSFLNAADENIAGMTLKVGSPDSKMATSKGEACCEIKAEGSRVVLRYLRLFTAGFMASTCAATPPTGGGSIPDEQDPSTPHPVVADEPDDPTLVEEYLGSVCNGFMIEEATQGEQKLLVLEGRLQTHGTVLAFTEEDAKELHSQLAMYLGL